MELNRHAFSRIHSWLVVPFEFSKKKKAGVHTRKKAPKKKRKSRPQLWRLRESIGIGKLCEKESCAYASDTQSRYGIHAYLQTGLKGLREFKEREGERVGPGQDEIIA